MPVEKPIVRTPGMLDTAAIVELCGQSLSVSDLLTQYKSPQTPLLRSGNEASVRMGDDYHAMGKPPACDDQYLTIQDAQTVCKDTALSVEAYNQMVRRFQLPEQQRVDRIITRYDRCNADMDHELMAEHPGLIERAHALYFEKETAPEFQFMGFDRQFDVLRFMMTVPMTPETERYFIEVAKDCFGRLDAHMATMRSEYDASSNESVRRRPYYIFNRESELQRKVWRYFGSLTEAEALVPQVPVWREIKLLLLTQVNTRQMALQNLDYDFLKNSPQIDVMHKLAIGKSGHVRNNDAFAWLLRLDYPKHRPQLLAKIAQSTRQKRAYPGLHIQLSRLDPKVVEGDEGLQVALIKHLAAMKRGRMDEELADAELNSVRAIRQVLISIFHQPPLCVSDPVAQLECRMQSGGTRFPNYEGDGNYEFCSRAGYLGREDQLLSTIQEDEVDLAKKGFAPEDLAMPLQVIRDAYQARYGEHSPSNIRFSVSIEGRNYDVYAPVRVLTSCPFIDLPGQNEGIEFVVSNDHGEVYHFVGLMPHLIGTHHFFEGKGTGYRVDPDEIIHFFDLKPSHKPK